MNIEKRRFVASLNTKVKSQFKAQIEPDVLCEKIKEYGGDGVVITDYEVLSSIESYKTSFESAGLKMIPGIEMNVELGSLGYGTIIAIAVNDNGYKCISKMCTESNKNLVIGHPVLSFDMFKKLAKEYKGDVIYTTSSHTGILAKYLLANKGKINNINNIKQNQKEFLNPSDVKVLSSEEALKTITKKIDDMQDEINNTKRIASQKFAKREKEIQKEAAKGKDVTLFEDSLKRDKEEAANAKEKLVKLQETIKQVKKEQRKITKQNETILNSVENYLKYEADIEKIKSNLLSNEELYKNALSAANIFNKIVGNENFYIELMYHGRKDEKQIMPELIKIAQELNIPVVATNNVHMLTNSKDERLKRQNLRSLAVKDEFLPEEEGDEELYLKDNFELEESLKNIAEQSVIDEAISNIEKIFNRCNVKFKTEEHYPKFYPEGVTVGSDFDTFKLFDEEIEKGIKWRYPNGIDKIRKDRIEYECNIIKSMGYADYLLVVKDYLEYSRELGKAPSYAIKDAPLTISELKKWLKDNKWDNNPAYRIGGGRGSAVGSIICFIFGITALDPIKYNLLFERFLNPERVSMPDIDSDFANLIRDKAIEYVDHKYGSCMIMTQDAQAPKGVVKIAAKYYGIKNYGESLVKLGEIIAKNIPEDVGTKFCSKVTSAGTIAKKNEVTELTLYDWLCDKFKDNKDALDVLSWAKILEGIFRTYSIHASGVCLPPNHDLEDIIPLRWNEDANCWTSQCDMVAVERNGILKFDFLGLKTCDIIDGTIKDIYMQTGKFIDILKLDLNDKEVYKNVIATGQTNSVFQLESDGMKDMLRRFGPDCFEDLILLISMYRPGPMQFLDEVIEVKNKRKEMSFLCPELEPILGKTYGAIVYQEQVMEICQTLAGYSLGQADMVRRFMSKKKMDKLEHEKESFIYGDKNRQIVGCVSNGISEDVAVKIFDQMIDFAKYAFNKSHAAAYALNCFATAWLKNYYPIYFFANAMNWAPEIKKLSGLMYEAKKFGVEVKAPNINESGYGFEVRDNVIYFGLSSVGGVKSNAQAIIEERKKGSFTSLKNFYKRVKPNKKVLENLISAGAFDEFSSNREAMKYVIPALLETGKKCREKQAIIDACNIVLPVIETATPDELIKLQENAELKAVIKNNTTKDKLLDKLNKAKESYSSLEEEFDLIIIPTQLEEDKNQRMAKEKSLLGLYVTEHTMDYYPVADEIGATTIEDTTIGENAVSYGVISDLRVVNRKKDGKPMAFFSIEDRSGEMKCCCFVQQFERCAEYIKENKVVKLYGSCVANETGLLDEDGVPVTEKEFIVERIEEVSMKLTSYFMPVNSYACFHVMEENSFIKEYAIENGHQLVIFDRSMNEMRLAKYKVSDKALALQNVEEI